MLESGGLRYLVIGGSVVAGILGLGLVSEVILYVYKEIKYRKLNPSLSEVVWTNELTNTCKHPPKDDAFVCPNKWCMRYNVGRLVELIDQSRFSIDLAMYTFTSIDLGQAIKNALLRGVKVRIICDREMHHSTGSQLNPLEKAGAELCFPESHMLMHHKFCILDGPLRVASIHPSNTPRTRGVLLNGSLNWTMQGLNGNWENMIITTNEIFVEQFESEYERIWRIFSNYMPADGEVLPRKMR